MDARKIEPGQATVRCHAEDASLVHAEVRDYLRARRFDRVRLFGISSSAAERIATLRGYSVALAPDFAYVADSDHLSAVDLATGASRRLAAVRAPRLLGVSPDDRVVALFDRDRLRLIDGLSGAQVSRKTRYGEELVWLAPDRFLFRAGGEARIYDTRLELLRRYRFYRAQGQALVGQRLFGTDRFKHHRWSGTWSRGWTHITPFSKDGEPRFFAYKSSTGKVSFNRINANGQGNTQLSSGTWGKGWTHFMPFSKGGNNYYVAYNSLYGHANLDRITAAGTGGSTIWQGSWGKSWTHLAPFDLDGVQYFLAYQASTGAVEIDKVSGSGNSLSINEDWSSTWSKEWSHIVPIGHNGKVHLLLYKSTTGQATFAKVKSGGEGVDGLATETWSKPWTTFSPFTKDGRGYFLANKTGTGQVIVEKLDSGGAGSSTIWSSWWSLGWI